jgi:hypothetical protein
LENRNLHAHQAMSLHTCRFQATTSRSSIAKKSDQSSFSPKENRWRKPFQELASLAYILEYAKYIRLFSQEEPVLAPSCFHFHPKLFHLKEKMKSSLLNIYHIAFS